MTIVECIFRLNVDLEKLTGKRDGLVKIALTYEVFESLVLELSKSKYGYPRLTDIGEVRIGNTLIVARKRDNF